MGFEWIAMVVAVWTALAGLAPALPADVGSAAVWRAAFGDATFRPRSREVTNWRLEAAVHLDAPVRFVADVLTGRTPASVSRCVKLNNYWCIKRAGWAGEIASDGEGHVAFASAAEGAQTAALLLRRYYVVYNLHSALAIVSRWAPAQCGVVAPSALLSRARAVPKLATLAVRGIGSTLRARFLAARGRGGKGTHLRASIIPDHALRLMRTPTIEAGVSEVPLKTVNLAALTLAEPGRSALAPLPPLVSCAAETQRLASYAAHVVAGLTSDTTQDLGLFDADGLATANLVRVMANMAAVEIGPLKPEAALLSAAVIDARARTARAPPKP